jgi:hypothetical protein
MGGVPRRGGVIVTCEPDVLFLRDRDGDGQADERRVLFEGSAWALSRREWLPANRGLRPHQLIRSIGN